ncbi:PIG-L family deacetylase [Candidatus Woesearchaeota archaeon]|nr:PIG-L family deacetylase [Candidatus Woesearchaeota archaeon]
MPKTILAIGAHNDDPAIGAGGTLAKYAEKGYRIRTVIMSFGVASNLYLKPEVIAETRAKESIEGDKILGGDGLIYFDLKEGKFPKEIKEKNVAKKLAEIIKKENPVMIFTHGLDDIHPDHRAVYKLVEKLVFSGKITCPVYAFDVWSLFRFRKRNIPKMVVDVSKTFNKKIKSILAHESQTAPLALLLWKIVLKDWLSGLFYGGRYAEVFYRLK